MRSNHAANRGNTTMPKISFEALENALYETAEDGFAEQFAKQVGLSADDAKTLFIDKGKISITREQKVLLDAFEYVDGEETKEDPQTEIELTDGKEDADALNVIDISIASQRDRDAVTVGEML